MVRVAVHVRGVSIRRAAEVEVVVDRIGLVGIHVPHGGAGHLGRERGRRKGVVEVAVLAVEDVAVKRGQVAGSIVLAEGFLEVGVASSLKGEQRVLTPMDSKDTRLCGGAPMARSPEMLASAQPQEKRSTAQNASSRVSVTSAT